VAAAGSINGGENDRKRKKAAWRLKAGEGGSSKLALDNGARYGMKRK
jgi:hypothetical protein